MGNAQRGISTHEMLHSLEGYRKSLVEKGHSDRDSLRCALALTFARSGKFTKQQAWEAANEIAAQRNAAPVMLEMTEPKSSRYESI